ncbi:hypothetical protein PENARI_c010G10101 [Penicillium arizonense]|uniref:Uncharacterized protein n=1 Tax=Penicillium arizonense TaxID=1835702 RepID=A0A1F5LH75_PENAI|nr:hypothetical protein PENARI_c010G10101 [Penicillium arizonense]OGE52495.1 hypothetical protein PENARI_c010G10101 [Penicillium arizonense]
MSPSLLQASAASFVLLSIGHTVNGRQWTSDPRFRAIAGTKPWASGTVGWYQGSAFFFLTGLLHYQWSRDPTALQDPINKAIAGIVNVLLWSSSAWYVKHGIKDNALAVGLSAVLQAWGVVQAIL